MSDMIRQMGLAECAKYDHDNKLKDVVTGWGRICKDRNQRGISRKQKRLARKNEQKESVSS